MFQAGRLVPERQLSVKCRVYLQEEPRALPGWERVMDCRDGSYSEFLGSQTYKKGGQGLLLEVVW